MKIWITRDEPTDGPLGSAITEVGLTAVHEPVLKRSVITNAREVISRLGFSDWLVFTSVNAIESVAADVARIPQVAVIDEATQKAAERLGFRVDFVSKSHCINSICDELKERAQGATVCYPRSSKAVEPAFEQDNDSKIKFISPVLYETQECPFNKSIVNEVNVVAVTSAAAVHAIGIVDLPFASIGPLTSSALNELGIKPWVEAANTSFQLLAEAIAAKAGSAVH